MFKHFRNSLFIPQKNKMLIESFLRKSKRKCYIHVFPKKAKLLYSGNNKGWEILCQDFIFQIYSLLMKKREDILMGQIVVSNPNQDSLMKALSSNCVFLECSNTEWRLFCILRL